MTKKRIVLIIMCAMLLLTAVMMAVVVGKVSPILGVLLGGGSKPPVKDPATQETTTAPTTTVPPTSSVPTDPTTEPPETTEGGDQPHEHQYTQTQVVPATCDAAGYTVYTCHCGKVDMRDVVEPLGHSYGPGKKVVLCEEQGYTEYTCVTCGHVDKQDPTEPAGHDYQLVEDKALTCTEDGYQLYRCQRCDGEKKENEQTAQGHQFSEWEETTTPGINQPGEETRTCAACEETEHRECVLKVSKEVQENTEQLNILTVYVGTEVTPKAFAYTIQDYSKAQDLTVEYSEDGLLVTYTDKSGAQQATMLARLQEVTLVIDPEGKIHTGPYTPPTDPTEPSTEVTEPTEAPTEVTVPSETPTAPTEN